MTSPISLMSNFLIFADTYNKFNVDKRFHDFSTKLHTLGNEKYCEQLITGMVHTFIDPTMNDFIAHNKFRFSNTLTAEAFEQRLTIYVAKIIFKCYNTLKSSSGEIAIGFDCEQEEMVKMIVPTIVTDLQKKLTHLEQKFITEKIICNILIDLCIEQIINSIKIFPIWKLFTTTLESNDKEMFMEMVLTGMDICNTFIDTSNNDDDSDSDNNNSDDDDDNNPPKRQRT